jgi:hypothetical protein
MVRSRTGNNSCHTPSPRVAPRGNEPGGRDGGRGAMPRVRSLCSRPRALLCNVFGVEFLPDWNAPLQFTAFAAWMPQLSGEPVLAGHPHPMLHRAPLRTPPKRSRVQRSRLSRPKEQSQWRRSWCTRMVLRLRRRRKPLRPHRCLAIASSVTDGFREFVPP